MAHFDIVRLRLGIFFIWGLFIKWVKPALIFSTTSKVIYLSVVNINPNLGIALKLNHFYTSSNFFGVLTVTGTKEEVSKFWIPGMLHFFFLVNLGFGVLSLLKKGVEFASNARMSSCEFFVLICWMLQNFCRI